MKTTVIKVALLLMISFAFINQSEAYGRYGYHCAPRGYYYGPRYYAPRYVPAPVVAAPCYGGVFIPGHYAIDRFGYRVWIAPHYRY